MAAAIPTPTPLGKAIQVTIGLTVFAAIGWFVVTLTMALGPYVIDVVRSDRAYEKSCHIAYENFLGVNHTDWVGSDRFRSDHC